MASENPLAFCYYDKDSVVLGKRMENYLGMGGFTTCGNNFDAKIRRQSMEPVDLFYGGDTLARGFLNPAAIIERGETKIRVVREAVAFRLS